MEEKINVEHLKRGAYPYIRHSTLQQVSQNVESNRRQYPLRDRALELGFEAEVGCRGAGSQQHVGFSGLLEAVCNGEVGAVLTFEALRLARNKRDWHPLIDDADPGDRRRRYQRSPPAQRPPLP